MRYWIGQAKKARFASPARKRRPGAMTAVERRYAAELDRRADVARWEFEAVKFRVGDHGTACWYTPDFLVVIDRETHAEVELHEVKAYWKSRGRVHLEDDARAKLLAVAARYPEHQFVLVYNHPTNGWVEERL